MAGSKTQMVPQNLLMKLVKTAPMAAKLLLEDHVKKRDQDLHNQLLKNLVIQYARSEYELHRLNQLKNKFLGIAAHDIRNPLISIRGLSDLLLAQEIGSINAPQRELIDMIRRTSEDLLNLVNNVLDISVIESDRFQLVPSHIDLVDITHERLKLLKLQADRKSTRFRLTSPSSVLVYADGNRMIQVIDNLLSNALKFSPPGAKVEVCIQALADEVRWQVSDQGPGIAKDEISLLFEAFRKLEAQPTAGESSTGLGLAITHKIIAAHGGRIEVSSTPAKGSVFEVVLPKGERDAHKT
jgi:two-component system sensor histidine kinase/response regulator